MNRFILLVFLFFPLISGFSWGPTGHRATGHVAEQYLNKKAKKNLQRILKGQSLAMASTWMDEVRSDSNFNFMADWHWVTIPDDQDYEKSPKNPKGDVVQTLERILSELSSGKLKPQEEADRVRILIHLVGDIHQPLHIGRGNDRGGNDARVMWFRVDSNLHRVWDSDMIDETKLSYTELAQSLIPPDEATLEKWKSAPVGEWVKESLNYREQVYSTGQGKLGYDYSYRNFPLVRERILQAGIRLAALLNQLYGK